MEVHLQYSGTGHSLWLQWLNVQLRHFLSHVSLLTRLYKAIAYNELPNEGERRKRDTRRMKGGRDRGNRPVVRRSDERIG